MKDLNKKRTKCEVYARIVGYIRPIEQWNDGKRAEYNDRKLFDKSVKEDQYQKEDKQKEGKYDN